MQSSLFHAVERLLPRVQTPSRYIGDELHAVKKCWDEVDVRFALAYPDLYDVGMSHLGTQVLYHLVNDRPDSLSERVFAPAEDMESLLREEDIPLFSLESRRPVTDFDLLGITLQYEMTYTNVLNLLSLARIPLRSEDRDDQHPFVLAGGPCAFNAEPLAPFFDLVCLGDGEDLLPQVIETYRRWREEGCPGGRDGFLRRIGRHRGMYIPEFFRPAYDADGELAGVQQVEGERSEIVKAVSRLDECPFPTRPVVPYTATVHDRASVEIFRGCTQGCRFCLAGMVYRPVRERTPDQVVNLCRDTIANTGYSEVSLASLSSTDHSGIQEVMQRLGTEFSDARVSISLPSLRVDDFSVEIAEAVKEVRDTGITLAPEAGTQRMRDVINKRVSEDDYVRALRAAFSAGCDTVKLYFMVGLPTETDDDVRGIARLVRLAHDVYRENPGSGRALQAHLSVACFIPKPHTPFQWEPQLGVDEFQRRIELLRGELPRRGLKFNWHDPEMSFLEGALARGDRTLADIVERAWRGGCRFDGWTEHFQPEKWYEAFSACGVDPDCFVTRERLREEILPWTHLHPGLSEKFLWDERERAYAGLTTEDCRRGECTDCGVCPNIGASCEAAAPLRSEDENE